MLRALRFQGPRAPYASGGLSFLFLVSSCSCFFFACGFFPPGPNGFVFTKGGGAHPEPRRRQPCRPMWQGVLIRGGRRCKHWPPGAGDPRYATEERAREPRQCQVEKLVDSLKVCM